MPPVSAAGGAPYQVDVSDEQIVVRVNPDAISPKDIADFLDYVYLENVRRKASLTDEQVAALAHEVNRAVWNRLRPMIEEKRRGG